MVYICILEIYCSSSTIIFFPTNIHTHTHTHHEMSELTHRWIEALHSAEGREMGVAMPDVRTERPRLRPPLTDHEGQPVACDPIHRVLCDNLIGLRVDHEHPEIDKPLGDITSACIDSEDFAGMETQLRLQPVVCDPIHQALCNDLIGLRVDHEHPEIDKPLGDITNTWIDSDGFVCAEIQLRSHTPAETESDPIHDRPSPLLPSLGPLDPRFHPSYLEVMCARDVFATIARDARIVRIARMHVRQVVPTPVVCMPRNVSRARQQLKVPYSSSKHAQHHMNHSFKQGHR